MTVVVAVPDSAEGRHALHAAAQEARQLDTSLVVMNLGLRRLDPALLPDGVELTVVDRSGPGDRDLAEVVLDLIRETRDVSRLVIGLKKRTPVGKAVFGSISQRLLLDSPVPVLAVKPPASSS